MGSAYSLSYDCGAVGVPRGQPSPISTSNRFDVLNVESNRGEDKAQVPIDHFAKDPTPSECYGPRAVGPNVAGACRRQQRQEEKLGWAVPPVRSGKRTYRPLNCLIWEAQRGEFDKTLNALGGPRPGARLVEAVVDSGAVDSVAPPGVFEGTMRPSAMSKRGKKYRGPDSSRIPNLGQLDVTFESDEGHKCGMTWQIAEIERPLIAVSHLSAAGNKVVLGKDGGEVVHEGTGRRIKVLRKGGVYVMRMWVPQRRSDVMQNGGPDFPRPGRA